MMNACSQMECAALCYTELDAAHFSSSFGICQVSFMDDAR